MAEDTLVRFRIDTEFRQAHHHALDDRQTVRMWPYGGPVKREKEVEVDTAKLLWHRKASPTVSILLSSESFESAPQAWLPDRIPESASDATG